MRLIPMPATLVAMVVAAGTAFAQLPPGSAGNAGRMPETMSPGALGVVPGCVVVWA